MDENQRSKKRRRLKRLVIIARSKKSTLRVTDYYLPDELVRACFSFVGPGHYRFVAGTCRHFQNHYRFRKGTTFKNAVASVSCAKLFRKDLAIHRQSSPCKHFPNSPIQVIVYQACCFGKLEVIQWAVDEHVCRVLERDFVAAASCGQLNVLKWCKSKGFESISPRNLWHAAATNGQVPILEWLHQCYPDTEWDCRTVEQCVVAREHVPVLEWMHVKGRKVRNRSLLLDDTLCLTASTNGRVRVLRWLLRNGYTNFAFSSVLEPAATCGHINVLQWARDHLTITVAWSASTWSTAARHGQLDTLRWLRENGCPWDSRTISCALNSRIAQWARDNGCPEP